MIGYASNTGTKRNLKALQDHGWGILLGPDNPKYRYGMSNAIDNGAWGCYQQGVPFRDKPFMDLVEKSGESADFVVIPDIVAGGMKSLDFSMSWYSRLSHLPLLLLPVQDGKDGIPDMDVTTVSRVLYETPNLGIFLGGSTEFKLATMYDWGIVAEETNCYYHVGRVNSMRRIRLCAESGADSFDGTSATMFSCSLPKLERANKQPSLLTPRLLTAPCPQHPIAHEFPRFLTH
jgi:hypothetical protein